jgi:hypothetical protein
VTSSGIQLNPAAIPTCSHTGLTLPECSCPECLRGMLISVGFLRDASASATASASAK